MRSHRAVSINNSLSHGICNYSCRLCSVNKPFYRGPRVFQTRMITAGLITRIEEAAHAGMHVRYVANSGDGEPTLHPDFGERMHMFGRMLAAWEAPVPPPEVSVVTNGTRLTRPGILDAVIDKGITLIISFPTPDPDAYGALMTGDAERGQRLLATVVPGIEAALARAGEGRLARIEFHISPPDREVIRRDFPVTLNFLTLRARASGLRELHVVMFPVTSNRSGMVSNRFTGTDMYRDLFRRFHNQPLNGVTIHMKLVLNRFFKGFGEIGQVLRAFRFPCLWNANLFIAADGSSICCNDQAMRNPMGNIMREGIAGLMAAKAAYLPGLTCAGCDQRPERMRGSLAAVAFAIAATVRCAAARKESDITQPASDAPVVYRFGADHRYVVRVAGSIEDRKKAWALVYALYLKKGYAQPDPGRLWYGIHDSLPETTTLLVERAGQPVATLTLVYDSPLGLPADRLYGAELEALRARGRKLCEIISLANYDGSMRVRAAIMKHLFRLSYLAAVRLKGATDLVITVNPRHRYFYEKKLLMKSCGPERSYDKVGGAPAILLGLDLETAEEQCILRYGDAADSYYRFFVNRSTEPEILMMLASGQRALDPRDLQNYFYDDRPLLAGLPVHQRLYVEECYPHR